MIKNLGEKQNVAKEKFTNTFLHSKFQIIYTNFIFLNSIHMEYISNSFEWNDTPQKTCKYKFLSTGYTNSLPFLMIFSDRKSPQFHSNVLFLFFFGNNIKYLIEYIGALEKFGLYDPFSLILTKFLTGEEIGLHL